MHRRLLFPVGLAAALLWLAMLLAGGPQWRWDMALAVLLHAGGDSALAAVARFATAFGGWEVLIPATTLAALMLLRKAGGRAALFLLAVTLGGRLFVDLQKWLFARARPYAEGHLVDIFNFSFPSGHAANATMTYVAIAVLLFRRRDAILSALLLAFAVGLSRVALGVHWPSDVIGGWAFGLLWTLGLLRLAEACGTLNALPSLGIEKETIMADTKQRPDDSELIESMGDAPSQSGVSGGNLQRDIASQAEEEHLIDGKTGVTRVRGEDKPAGGDRPNLPNRD